MTEARKKKLRKAVDDKVAGIVADIKDESEEESAPSAGDLAKTVTDQVSKALSDHPVLKALGDMSKSAEPDEDAELKKYMRRYVRKTVDSAVEVASEEIIKAVCAGVTEMFGGEENVKKINKIGKKLKVVSKKKSAAPKEDADDEDGDDESFAKREPGDSKGRRDAFSKKGSVEELDKTLFAMAKGAFNA